MEEDICSIYKQRAYIQIIQLILNQQETKIRETNTSQ